MAGRHIRSVGLHVTAGLCVVAAFACIFIGEMALAGWNALNALWLKVCLVHEQKPARAATSSSEPPSSTRERPPA